MPRSLLALAVLIATLAAAASPSGAGTIRHDRSDASYLAYGTQFSSVGRITGSFPEGGGLVGSGVLIAPDLVLTAAHVVEDTSRLSFSFPERGQSYDATEAIIHPGWNGDVLTGYDLSIFRLDRPVTDVAPSPRFRGWFDSGRAGATAGYGTTGTGLTGYSGSTSTTRRAGVNGIDRRYNNRILLSDFDAPNFIATGANLGTAAPANLEYLIAPGDSGGGLFVWADRAWRLVGINSFVMSYDGDPDASYGDSAGFTRVRVFQNWIDSIVNGRIDLLPMSQIASMSSRAVGGAANAARAVALVPEPGAGAAFTALAAAAMWRRRR